MSKNTTETICQRITEVIDHQYDGSLPLEKNTDKLKLINHTLHVLNSKIQELKSLVGSSDLIEIQKSIYTLPNIENLHTSISDLLQRDNCSTDLQKIIYEVPTEMNIIEDDSSNQFYQIPIEMIPFDSPPLLYQVPLEMSVVVDEDQVCEYLSRFDTFEKLPSSIRNHLTSMSTQNNTKVYEVPVEMFPEEVIYEKEIRTYELPVEMNFLDSSGFAGVNAFTQTQIQPLEDLEKYSIANENSDKELQEIDDTLVRMRGMIQNLSRKTSQFSSEVQSMDSDDQKNKIDYNFKVTGKISEDLKLVHEKIDQNTLMKEHKVRQIYEVPIQMEIIHEQKQEEDINEIKKSLVEDYFYEIPIEIQPMTATETQVRQNEEKDESAPFYEIPVEIRNIPECSFQYQIYSMTIQPPSKEKLNIQQVDIYSLNLPNLQNIGLKNRSISKLQKSRGEDENSLYHKKDTSRSMKKSNNRSIGPVACDIPLTQPTSPVFIINDGTSSEGSRTDREIYLSQIRGSHNIELNMNENSGFKEPPFEIEEFYDLKEKLCNSEEQKIQLLERLRMSEHQIKTLKDEVILQKESLNHLEKSVFREEDKLKSAQISLIKLETEKTANCDKIFELTELNNFLEEKLGYVLKELKDRQDQIEEISARFQDIQGQFMNEMQRLNNQITQKENLLKEFEKEEDSLKKEYRNEINDLLKMNEELKITIEEQNKEIQGKKNQNEELKSSYDELMRHFEHACQQKNQINQLKTIFTKEYEKVKDQFDHQVSLKEKNITELNNQNKKLSKDLLKEKGISKNMKEALAQSNQDVNNLRLEIQQYKDQISKTKLNVASQVEAQLDYLRRELVYAAQEVDFRELKIRQLNSELKKLKENQKNFKVQFLKDESQSDYIEQLKDMIMSYQKIILSHHSVIKQLQDRVYQYLNDALQKEDEAQSLHETILNYETDMNDLLLEKIAVQLENKKLKRSMKASERKISTLGNRLLVVAKDKLNEDSLQMDPKLRRSIKKTQNSTIKLGSDL